MELAERLHGEIVSVDSLQAYRGLDIGTAKPSAAERDRIPHHLIDIYEPSVQMTAGAYATLAREVIGEIQRRGHQAILAGGSGLYLRAILEGMSPIPSVDEITRRALTSRLEVDGLGALREMLEEMDPQTASRIEPADTQRTLRALEVVVSTGKGLAEWQKESSPSSEQIVAKRIGLTLPRNVLYDRIEQSVRSMIQEGWLEEVTKLLAGGLDPSVPAFQAIGYRQMAAHIQGGLTLDEATEEIVRATRRFAKRQLTWFRRVSNVCWISAEDPRGALQETLDVLERAHLGGENG
jgi:tRNA dimethylallyltransferase